MPACSVHWYPKVPAVLNVRESELTIPMSGGTPTPPSNVTLWALPSVHVTVPPTAMSTLAGEKKLPGVETFALIGNALATLIVRKLDAVALPSVASAVMFAFPAATPVTRPVVAPTIAIPVAFELHVTVDPAIGLPFWSFGETVS